MCQKFRFLYNITASCFQGRQLWLEAIITLISWICISQGSAVQWHFFRFGGQLCSNLCQLSFGLCVPKIIKIGIFLTELYKNNGGRGVFFLRHVVTHLNMHTCAYQFNHRFYCVLSGKPKLFNTFSHCLYWAPLSHSVHLGCIQHLIHLYHLYVQNVKTTIQMMHGSECDI